MAEIIRQIGWKLMEKKPQKHRISTGVEIAHNIIKLIYLGYTIRYNLKQFEWINTNHN